MKRNEFLKSIGLAGAATLFSFDKARVKEIEQRAPPPNNCVLIPSETAGPFPLDLTANPFYFRQDVRESKTGVQLNLKLKIIGLSNCLPMQNARVNIWHCDKDGLYSGYGDQQGLTYLRGYQMTNANGEVEFVTIFPGWYTGRICHIHFQVYLSSSYAAISQLTFPIATKNAIYAANPSLYTKGTDPLTFSNDNIFSDGYTYQLATLTPNTQTGGYDSYLEVTVQGSGVSGVGHIEKENAKQFTLVQNFPNPFEKETTIPFRLAQTAEVRIEIWDLNGKRVATLLDEKRGAGEHQVKVDLDTLGLPNANYAYQIEVRNSDGVFRDCKLMTIAG